MKKIILGILFAALGAGAALAIFYPKKTAAPGQTITIPGIEKKFEPTKFSLENAPSESIKGQIIQMNGEVWKQDRTATEPARLINPGVVQQGEILIASDEGKLTAEFNPAVTLTLFPDTRVEIVQTLPVNLVFNHSQGVSQFLVAGTNPVTVRSLNLIANIDEGLFVIDTDPETGRIILSQKTGAGKVAYNSPEFTSKVWELAPGDVFTYDANLRRGYFK